MRWTLTMGEVDVTAHNNTLYLIDGRNEPFVNRLDGNGTQSLGSAPVADEMQAAREEAADICARDAGVAPGNHIFEEWS